MINNKDIAIIIPLIISQVIESEDNNQKTIKINKREFVLVNKVINYNTLEFVDYSDLLTEPLLKSPAIKFIKDNDFILSQYLEKNSLENIMHHGYILKLINLFGKKLVEELITYLINETNIEYASHEEYEDYDYDECLDIVINQHQELLIKDPDHNYKKLYLTAMLNNNLFYEYYLEMYQINNDILIEIKYLLDINKDKRVVVVGTSCTGKSYLLKDIPEGKDMDDLIFPLLSKEETEYVNRDPWTPEIGKFMTKVVKERIKVQAGQPVFGTVVLDSDLIIYLVIDDELLRKRTDLRQVNFNNAKNMQKRLETEIETSGISSIIINVTDVMK